MLLDLGHCQSCRIFVYLFTQNEIGDLERKLAARAVGKPVEQGETAAWAMVETGVLSKKPALIERNADLVFLRSGLRV